MLVAMFLIASLCYGVNANQNCQEDLKKIKKEMCSNEEMLKDCRNCEAGIPPEVTDAIKGCFDENKVKETICDTICSDETSGKDKKKLMDDVKALIIQFKKDMKDWSEEKKNELMGVCGPMKDRLMEKKEDFKKIKKCFQEHKKDKE